MTKLAKGEISQEDADRLINPKPTQDIPIRKKSKPIKAGGK